MPGAKAPKKFIVDTPFRALDDTGNASFYPFQWVSSTFTKLDQ